MVNDKYMELMNRSIDGLLSSDEQAELENYLKAHPEARQQYENLKRVSEVLKKTPGVKPPLDMKQNIMDNIRSREESIGEKRGFFEIIVNTFRNRLSWRYSYAFSAGILFGIVVMAVSMSITEAPTPLDPSQVSGTLMPAELPKDGSVLDSKEFSIGAVSGTLSIRQSGNLVILETDIDSEEETSIRVFFDSADLSFAGIWQPEYFRGSFDRKESHLDLLHQGKGKYYLLFINRLAAVSKLTFEIKSGNLSHNVILSTGQ
jgi:hypothetical protein